MEKQTKIPELRFPDFERDWERKKIIDFAPLQRGFDLPVNTIIDGKYPVVFSNGILKYHNEFKVKGPGVVTGRSGTIGKVTYVEDNFWAHNTSLWVTNFNGNHPKFVYYFYSRYKLENLATGSGVPTLNRNDIHCQKEYFPYPPEQKKIASFFTSIDKKISQLKQKKTLLEQYKKGVMRKIFSQEIRFRDENGQEFPKWEKKRLGEVAKFFKGKGISKNDIDENGILACIRYGELYTIYQEKIDIVKSRTSVNPKYLILSEADDVIIPASGETQIDIATASCVLKSGIALGGDLNIIRSNFNGVFLSYLLNSKMKREIAKLSQGISVVHLYSSQLSLLKLEIPTVLEQAKIASFLSAIDDKINHTQTKIEKVELWKKGLLQKMFV